MANEVETEAPIAVDAAAKAVGCDSRPDARFIPKSPAHKPPPANETVPISSKSDILIILFLTLFKWI